MEALFNTYLVGLATAIAYMTCWYFVSLSRKRADIADIAWGTGFVVIAVVTMWYNDNTSVRMLLATLLVLVWGVRLALHIEHRNRGKTEDFRYQAMREKWGKHHVIRSYVQVFLLQAVLMSIVALPLVLISTVDPLPIDQLVYNGILLWLFGFFFEVVGDWQLGRYLSDESNRGKPLQAGLWKYTRHPNYFGEVCMWWGIWLIGSTLPYAWFGLAGPISITILILFVSGVPMLEKKWRTNPAFADYISRTSIFIPWFPKRKPSSAKLPVSTKKVKSSASSSKPKHDKKVAVGGTGKNSKLKKRKKKSKKRS